MIRNYIKLAWRNLLKDKTFSLLNLLGLSVAFGVAILLGMAAFFDLSYDGFHKNSNNLFQVYNTEQTAKGAKASVSQAVPLAGALQDEVSGVASISRYLIDDALVTYGDKQVNLETVYTDNDFFSMFSFPIKEGTAKDPLEEKSSIVVTQKIANLLFGQEEAVGKTVNILLEAEERSFTVSAVVQDFVQHSSLHFDIALNFENSPEYAENLNEWGNKNHSVYVQLEDGISAEQFEKNSRAFTALHYKENNEAAKRDGAQLNSYGDYIQLRLFPFKDVHFASVEDGIVRASKTYPYIILGIGLLVLLIASVNFINMSIAKSTQRLREIGMRKSLGASKWQLFFQFWTESLFIFFGSVCLGILISYLLLEPFQTLFSTSVSFSNVISLKLIIGFFVFVLLITVVAGGYPALLLSKLGTLQALKNKIQVSGRDKVRDVLMVVQFVIAISLISGTFVLWSQLDFMRTKDLGFNKEQVVSFPLNGKKDSRAALELLRNELQDEPNILSISAADNNLGVGKDGSISSHIIGFEYKGRGVETNLLVVSQDYVETLGLKLVSGRAFDRQHSADGISVLVNEAMVKEINEEEPLHKQINMGGMNYNIIGVLENYNFQDLNSKIEPLSLVMIENMPHDYAFVKVAPQDLSGSFNLIKDSWNKIEPSAAFLGSFLDENIERTLRRETTMTTIITSGAIVAIILSCIGLFAISLLVVTRRTKEIGVRKILGAGVFSITFLLTVDFLKLMVLAFLIAAPVAWWSSAKWLQGYAYQIDLRLWFFILAGVLTVVIALATISIKTIKAALQNPIKSLRTE